MTKNCNIYLLVTILLAAAVIEDDHFGIDPEVPPSHLFIAKAKIILIIFLMVNPAAKINFGLASICAGRVAFNPSRNFINGKVWVEPGKHQVAIEYFELGSWAELQVNWQLVE